MKIHEKLTIERNDNYALGDVRANYFLMYDGADCIGGIDTQSDTGLVASIHIPSVIDEDGDEENESNWTDCTVVATIPYESDADLESAKTALLHYATMAINSGEIQPRDRYQLWQYSEKALVATWSNQ